MATRGLYIDGAWTEGQGTTTVPVLNPATEDVIAEVPEATPADIDAAVGAARRAFDDGPWPTMKPAERAKILG
ncbi:aldehyde dehydrogenase, partial [Enterococcus faecium]